MDNFCTFFSKGTINRFLCAVHSPLYFISRCDSGSTLKIHFADSILCIFYLIRFTLDSLRILSCQVYPQHFGYTIISSLLSTHFVHYHVKCTVRYALSACGVLSDSCVHSGIWYASFGPLIGPRKLQVLCRPENLQAYVDHDQWQSSSKVTNMALCDFDPSSRVFPFQSFNCSCEPAHGNQGPFPRH